MIGKSYGYNSHLSPKAPPREEAALEALTEYALVKN